MGTLRLPGWARSWGGKQDLRVGDLGGRVKERPQDPGEEQWGGARKAQNITPHVLQTKLWFTGVAGIKQQNPWQSAGWGKVATQ